MENARERPIVELKMSGQQLLIVANETGVTLLGDMLSGRSTGTAYAERALTSAGEPQTVCVVCCRPEEVALMGPTHAQVQEALDDLFTYYTVEDPIPEHERFGLSHAGMTI